MSSSQQPSSNGAAASPPLALPSVSEQGAAALIAPSRRTTQHQHHGDVDADEEHSQEDLLDEILENYTFVCHPEIRLKFKQQLRLCSLGLSLAKPWHSTTPRVRFVVKPAAGTRVHRYVSKLLAVPTHGLLCLYSAKIPLGFLRLQFMASLKCHSLQPSLDYRVTTKWSDGPRIKRKERYHLGRHALVRCKWNMDLHLPDMEGHLGGDVEPLEAVNVDYGRLDFEISQLDLCFHSPWGAHAASGLRSPPSTPRGGAPPLPAAAAEGSLAAPSAAAGGWRAGRRGKTPEASTAAQQRPAQAVQQAGSSKQAGVAGGVGGAPAASTSKAAVEARSQEVMVPQQGSSSSSRPQQQQQQGPGVPDWLVGFLSKLSVQPLAQPRTGA